GPAMAPSTSPELPPSLWAATAAPGPPTPPLVGPVEADVAVIGGGFTGLSAALHLAEAGKRVVLLEQAEPGWGASGRNGGQVNPGWKVLPSEIKRRHGAERGERIARMAHGTCDLVFELIDRFGISCEALRPGFLQAAYGHHGRAAQENWAREWSAYGAEVELLDRDDFATLIGTDAYDGGLCDARGGNIQPLSYARGLAEAAAGQGAALYGGSPATGVERKGTGWQVTTPEGRVSAEQLVIGTNGYTDDLWPGLKETVVPVPSFIVASRPLSQNLAKSILPGRHAVSETRRVLFYFRMDRDDRFVFGGRGKLFDSVDHKDGRPMDHLKAEARRLYPQLADTQWDFSWGGYVAVTREHTPRLMRLAPGAFAGLGYNGRGVAMATMMGKQLALAVLGEDPAMEIEELRPIPFHGLRQIGVSWHLLTGGWLDRFDRLR
ncbi:MAG: FAD-binding oxidoreductase, partial [Kiloniellales bacterium]|nr:FAD-binding oxidoreductase [Kiloniellales bacterium]